jgi:hypothetical protein
MEPRPKTPPRTRFVTCTECKGDGKDHSSWEAKFTDNLCPDCKGTGKGPEGFACWTCGGRGKTSLPGIDYPTPMTPQTLSDAVADVVSRAQARVGPGSVGAEQYHVEGQPQKFERMDLTKLIDYSIEEALDHINYGVMLTIRLDRLRQDVEGIEARIREKEATE